MYRIYGIGQKNSNPEMLRVGFFQYDGYHEMDDMGNKSGYGYEVLQLLARYENVTYEYTGYEKNWSQMLEMLEAGELDLLTSGELSHTFLHQRRKHLSGWKNLIFQSVT